MQLLLVALQLLAGLPAADTAEVLPRGRAETGDDYPVLEVHMYTPFCYAGPCPWPSGTTMDISVQQMLGHLNDWGYLRGNRTLNLKVFDTACSPANGRDEVAKLLLLPREEWPFAVIGCGCSGCSRTVSPLLNLARVPHMSHGSTSPSLSNRTLFPNFFRLSTADTEGIRAQLLVFRTLDWRLHAQVYDVFFGMFTVPFALQLSDDLGMVNVLAGRSIAAMREASLPGAQPMVEALVQARVRAIIWIGYLSSLWYVGCAMFKRNVRGTIVTFMGSPFEGWWELNSSPCTHAEMRIAVNYWFSVRNPTFTDFDAEVECLPPGVTLEAFVEAFEKRRVELGVDKYLQAGPAGDIVCFIAKIFNTLIDMGFTAGEVHNMNESTYATYSSVVQRLTLKGISGPISFPSDPNSFGAGDRINIFQVWQLQDSIYIQTANLEGQSIIFAGPGSEFSFFGNHTLAKPPAALFPACPLGVYNFLTEQCEGCPFGSDFIETEGSCFCSPGFRVNGTECSPCAEGSFSTGFGAETCELCDKGLFAPSRGQTTCERCPLGTFMPRLGGAACEPCGLGLHSTTLERGADAAAKCVCEEGSSLRNDTISCELCSEGLLCAAGLSPPQQWPGFWAERGDHTHELVVWRCRNIRECNGGAVGECAAGRQGRSCNDCESSHRPSDDGTCKPCDSWDLVPAVITLVSLLAVLVCVLALVRVDENSQNLELVGITIIATQLCMVLQMLGVFAQIQIRWLDPASVIVDNLRFLLLDLDVIHGDCWLPSADPVSKFAFQLLTFPSWACAVLLAWFASQYTQHALSSTDVFSLLGTVLFMVFIVLTVTVLLPFQCQSNPSGRTSMAAHPGMVCFESAEHWTLVVMAMFGFAVYPATCLTWASWATMKYPAWISSGYGLHLVRKYRFLFGRFKPEHYYFGLFMLYRNFCVALLPIVLVSVQAAQIVILSVLLVCSALFVAHTFPWRTLLANCTDVLMLFCTAVFLTGMAMLVQVTEEIQLGLGWLLSFLMTLPLALGLSCVACGVWKNIHWRLHYEVFLSHHKGGAGVLARLLKFELAKVGVSNAFLDVDSLENLDTLFHIVRRQTQNMVVLLSSETLKRMWCAGEIVTAHRNNVPTVPVLLDGYKHLDEFEISDIPHIWTAADKQTLRSLGITWEMTKAAYSWLQQLPCVELPRFCSEADHGQNVQSIIKLCSRIKAGPPPRAPPVSRPEILITGAVSDAEALAACQVFRVMLQQATRVEAAVVRTASDVQQAQGTANHIVVLLTRRVLLDERFAEIILAANKNSGGVKSQTTMRSVASGKMGATGTMKSVKSVVSGSSSGDWLNFVTVNADAGFKFPSKDFYEGLRRDGFGGNDTESLISAYQSLLRILALPFSPLGSVNLLQHEVSEIRRRRFTRFNSQKHIGRVNSTDSRSKLVKGSLGKKGIQQGAEEEDVDEDESTADLEDFFLWPQEVTAPAVVAPPVRHKTVPLP